MPDETSTADRGPFWTACDAGRLDVQQCADCGRAWHVPVERCPECFSTSFQWVATSGRGRIYSFVTVRRGRFPGFEDRVPYVVALVEIDDFPGVRLFTNIVGSDPQNVHIDAKVRVAFHELESGTVPVFELDE